MSALLFGCSSIRIKLDEIAAPEKRRARNNSPLPMKTVENKRSSTAPSCSRITPMNHRNAIPAKGTSWRLSRISSRRSSSASRVS